MWGPMSVSSVWAPRTGSAPRMLGVYIKTDRQVELDRIELDKIGCVPVHIVFASSRAVLIIGEYD